MKILAIDDYEDSLTILQALLHSALPACVFLTARNGPDGIELARAEDPDVILLDIVMPGMDGFEVCRRLKADELLCSIPVVVLTAFRADRESRLKALESGAEAFLSKPLDEPELVALIRTMAKLKVANRHQRLENEQLAARVAERTRELEQKLDAHKRAEEALKASEQEFRTLAEAVPQIVWITRADGWNIFFNQQWVDYTGMTLAASYGHGWNIPFHPEDQQRAWEAWKNATQNGATYSLKSRLRRADGAYHWWLIRGVPLRNADGTILKWFGTCTDIEDIMNTEASLLASEKRFRDVLETISLIAVMLDQTGKITLCNDFLLALTGWQREAVLDQNWFEMFLPPEIRDAMQYGVFLKSIASGDIPVHYENEILTRAGERRLIVWHNTILRDSHGLVIGVASIGEDITDRRRLEQERVVMEAQLRQQQKLESIGTLASGVAHEINNPINGVMNYAQLILDDNAANPTTAGYAKEIIGETERVATIVRNLLQFARHEKSSHSPARIEDLIEQTLSLIRTVIRHDQITLDVEVPKDLPEVNCRSQQIQQVLMNLLTNARDSLNEKYPGYHQDKKIIISAQLIADCGLRIADCGIRSSPIQNPESAIRNGRFRLTHHGSRITDHGSRVTHYRPRPWHGHPARSAGPDFRSLFQHQIAPPRHRPWPGHQPWHCERSPRPAVV